MTSTPHVALLGAVLLALTWPMSARSLANPCRGRCACFEGVVTCQPSAKLTAIPNNFEVNVRQLIMKKQPFVDKTLRRHNVSYLSNLMELYLNDCGLESLEVGVFSDLSKLRQVDLSGNKIRDIYDSTFRGLRLNFLFLNNNPDIRLHRHSFKGLTTAGLSMKNCGLRSIAYETFLALNASIKSLWLNGNELAELDPRFELIFGHLETLDVKGNPFECKCSLRWLVLYLRRQSTSSASAELGPNPSPAEQPRCAMPKDLAGVELRSLAPAQLTCDPPRLGDVDVFVQASDSGRLRCTATGYPLPTVAWRRVVPRVTGRGTLANTLRVVNPSPFLSNFNPRRPVTNEVAVDRRRRSESFECIASNDGGNVTLTVRVRWPPKIAAPVMPKRPKAGGPLPPQSRPSPVPGGPNNGLETIYDDPRLNYQFTLLELIGAVVGTFTATLALFLLICRCITYVKKKQKKQQWSTYESAYSGSHVYDVPRNEQGYMPKPADRHEFLDFKTGRKVYDHV